MTQPEPTLQPRLQAKKLEPTDQDLVWAAKVLDNVGMGVDLASAKPELLSRFGIEMTQKAPVILEALLYMVRPDCQIIVFDLAQKLVNLVNSWSKGVQKSQPK